MFILKNQFLGSLLNSQYTFDYPELFPDYKALKPILINASPSLDLVSNVEWHCCHLVVRSYFKDNICSIDIHCTLLWKSLFRFWVYCGVEICGLHSWNLPSRRMSLFQEAQNGLVGLRQTGRFSFSSSREVLSGLLGGLEFWLMIPLQGELRMWWILWLRWVGALAGNKYHSI